MSTEQENLLTPAELLGWLHPDASPELQALALKVLEEENARFARGDLTPEERMVREYGSKLGKAAAKTTAIVATEVFNP